MYYLHKVVNCIFIIIVAGVCILAATISTPEFIGPIYANDTNFYFVCRVVHTDFVETTFDVTLLFDGKHETRVAIKTVSSASSFDVSFTQQDFAGQYGKSVSRPFLSITKNYTVRMKRILPVLFVVGCKCKIRLWLTIVHIYKIILTFYNYCYNMIKA